MEHGTPNRTDLHGFKGATLTAKGAKILSKAREEDESVFPSDFLCGLCAAFALFAVTLFAQAPGAFAQQTMRCISSQG